jgi:hypothetical protein
MDLDLGDPGAADRVDDLLRMDGDTTIEEEQEGDESGMSLVGEGMCGDGAAALEELRQQYEVIDKQNEVGKEESMSVASGSSIGGASISIGGGNKRPSPESNSGVEGASEVTESNSVIDGDRPSKKTRAKRHVFTALEKQILVNLYETNKLMDTKGIKDVVLLLSKDDNKLSEAQVKTWVDNYKSSLRKKQKGKETDPKDKDQE